MGAWPVDSLRRFEGKTVYIQLKNQQTALKGILDPITEEMVDNTMGGELWLDDGRTFVRVSEIAAVSFKYPVDSD